MCVRVNVGVKVGVEVGAGVCVEEGNTGCGVDVSMVTIVSVGGLVADETSVGVKVGSAVEVGGDEVAVDVGNTATGKAPR